MISCWKSCQDVQLIGIYRGNKVNYIIFFSSSNSIEYFIASNRILQFTSRNSVTSLFSLATTDIDLALLRHSTYPSALVKAYQMMNWPNKFLIWSSTSTLTLSVHFKWMRHKLPIKLFNGCGCNRPNYLSFGAGNDQVFYCIRPTIAFTPIK